MTAPGGDTWQFVYDPTANVPAVLAEVKNGDLQAFYVREPGGELIARVAGEDRKYYFCDGLGSVMAMAPAVEGNPTDRYFYTPWGEPDTRAQSLSATTGNPYRYVGQLGYYFHHQIPALQNWLQLGVRFYAPEAGRFERRDPLRRVPYLYATAQPMRAVDPSGLASWIRVEDPDTGQWWNPAYVHAFIHFDFIKCMGASDWGFYGVGVIPQKTYVGDPEKNDKWWKVREKRSTSIDFEIALCKCITESKAHPPTFSTDWWHDFYVCGSWVADMWECAKRRLCWR